MKYRIRHDFRRKPLLCKNCGLGGLTLVQVGAKIEGDYEHQTPYMCAQAQRIHYYLQTMRTAGIRARIKALKERLEA